MASRVEKRMALTLPVFIFERFTFAMPTRSESSFRDIFLSAITRSSLSIIGTYITFKASRPRAAAATPYISAILRSRLTFSALNGSLSCDIFCVILMQYPKTIKVQTE